MSRADSLCATSLLFMRVPKIMGTVLGGPDNKGYSILGSILGSSYLGNYHFCLESNSAGLLDRTAMER